MAILVYVGISPDGCIATPDGGLDWLISVPNPEQSDYGFSEFMERVDAIVMGRKIFEMVASFGSWSYSKTVFVPTLEGRSVL